MKAYLLPQLTGWQEGPSMLLSNRVQLVLHVEFRWLEYDPNHSHLSDALSQERLVYAFNKIFVISVLGLGGVVFDSAWGVIPPPPPTKETLLEIGGGNFFTA
jgi:hypothetical protein